VLVKGINLMKRHVKAKREGEKGERIEKGSSAPCLQRDVGLPAYRENRPGSGTRSRAAKRFGQ